MKENNSTNNNEEKSYICEGMCIGLAVGTAFGTIIGIMTEIWYMPICSSIGMCIGLAIGANIKKKDKKWKMNYYLIGLLIIYILYTLPKMLESVLNLHKEKQEFF